MHIFLQLTALYLAVSESHRKSLLLTCKQFMRSALQIMLLLSLQVRRRLLCVWVSLQAATSHTILLQKAGCPPPCIKRAASHEPANPAATGLLTICSDSTPTHTLARQTPTQYRFEPKPLITELSSLPSLPHTQTQSWSCRAGGCCDHPLPPTAVKPNSNCAEQLSLPALHCCKEGLHRGGPSTAKPP